MPPVECWRLPWDILPSRCYFSWQVICLPVLLSSHFIFGYHAELGHALTYLNCDFRQLFSPSWGLDAMSTDEEYWWTTEICCEVWICVYSWVYEYAHLCRYTRRPAVHTRTTSSIAFQPHFLIQGDPLALEFLIWLDWLASEPLRSTCLHDPLKAEVSYKQHTNIPGFYIGAGGQNSSRHEVLRPCTVSPGCRIISTISLRSHFAYH